MRCLQIPRRRTDSQRVLVLLAGLALLLPACFGDGAEKIQAQAQGGGESLAGYPEWLEKVYPPPDSQTSATQAVQVNHGVVEADRQVRLIIDGTDVTSYAVATAPGLLEYDVDQVSAPVELDPGEHTAVVELTRVTPGASEGVESFDADVHGAVDSFRWTFTVL